MPIAETLPSRVDTYDPAGRGDLTEIPNGIYCVERADDHYDLVYFHLWTVQQGALTGQRIVKWSDSEEGSRPRGIATLQRSGEVRLWRSTQADWGFLADILDGFLAPLLRETEDINPFTSAAYVGDDPVKIRTPIEVRGRSIPAMRMSLTQRRCNGCNSVLPLVGAASSFCRDCALTYDPASPEVEIGGMSSGRWPVMIWCIEPGCYSNSMRPQTWVAHWNLNHHNDPHLGPPTQTWCPLCAEALVSRDAIVDHFELYHPFCGTHSGVAERSEEGTTPSRCNHSEGSGADCVYNHTTSDIPIHITANREPRRVRPGPATSRRRRIPVGSEIETIQPLVNMSQINPEEIQ